MRLSHALLMQYGISGSLQALRAYEGYNFHLLDESRKQSFVIKLIPANTALQITAGRNAILKHLQKQKLPFSSPKIIETRDGKDFLENPFDKNNPCYHVQVLSYLEGELVADWKRQKLNLFSQWGELCASMKIGLQSFYHPSFELKSGRNFNEFPGLIGKISHISDRETRQAVERQFNEFDNFVASKLLTLPKSVLHNDLNELNILFCCNKRGEANITGVIDFQDASMSQAIGELAIACAYAMMNRHAPKLAMNTMLNAYKQKLSLTKVEEDLLVPLVKTRLAMSLLHSSYEFAQNPDNRYLLHSQKPATRLLLQLGKQP